MAKRHATPPERWAHAITLWLRILAIVSTSQLWMQYVPVQRFIRALFASRLPPGVAYLFAGPLLVVEQLKRQLAIIHEAQRAAACRWMRLVSAFTCDARVNYSANTNALNDLAVRGAALDMRAFRINNRRTTLWAPADSTLQRVARYAMILLMLTEFGAWIWLR